MNKLRVIELFGGIGACSKAIERLGIPYEIADYVEIDKYAVKSFNAIHGTNFEPQDIKEWDKDIEADLIMHGSPCQDFSVAGKGAGGDKDSGTRSSLMYETLRIVEKIKPKYVIWENVKNLLSKKHIHNFEAYQEAMRELGYVNYYKVLNAKDYGIPQNRERVFTVSIRDDHKHTVAERLDNFYFEFPAPFPLGKKLKDILDDEVDEKYYLNENRIKSIKKWEERQIENGRGFRFEVKDGESVGRAVTTSGDRPASTNYIKVTNATKRGYDIATDGDSINLQFPNSTTRRGRVGHGVSQTLQANDSIGVVVDSSVKPSVAKNFEREKEQIATTDKEIYRCKCETAWQDNKVGCKVSPSLRSSSGCTYGLTSNYRIRKLTPKECWRLMGFDDSDFEKAEKVNSNSQLYKQAGNSIVVNVLEGILKNLLDNDYGRC